MKKNLLLTLVLFICTSCYEDYIKDYDFAGIYFTNQTDVRSFIVGERESFNLGAVLGGVLSNDRNRDVYFEIAPELINDDILDLMRSTKYDYIKDALNGVDHLQLLPENWYSLSNNEKMVIKKGNYAGIISVTANNDFYVNEDETLKAQYALPLKITSADADSIMEGKEYTVIGVKYECKLFGNYYHYGEWISYDVNDNETNRDKISFEIPMPDNTINELTTIAPYTVVASRAANIKNYKMNITLNEDNTISLSAPKGSSYKVENIGNSIYNNPKLLQDRKLFLNYKITKSDGSYVIAKDTLAFRNRIRDGVNEWRDENPNNY